MTEKIDNMSDNKKILHMLKIGLDFTDIMKQMFEKINHQYNLESKLYGKVKTKQNGVWSKEDVDYWYEIESNIIKIMNEYLDAGDKILEKGENIEY